MTTICRIESNSNYYFVLRCQENHEPVFDPSPICLHGDATGPQAGLQAFAFTPDFCLSNALSWLFHHASALILCKHLQQRSVMPHLIVQIIIKATILLPQNMKLSFFYDDLSQPQAPVCQNYMWTHNLCWWRAGCLACRRHCNFPYHWQNVMESVFFCCFRLDSPWRRSTISYLNVALSSFFFFLKMFFSHSNHTRCEKQMKLIMSNCENHSVDAAD